MGGLFSKIGASMLLAAVSAPALAFVQPVPEPDTLLLLLGGAAAVLIAGKLRGRK